MAEQTPEHAREPAPDVPPQLRMPLLTLITQQSLDEDYLHAAQRRRTTSGDGAEAGGGSRARSLTVVAVLVFGLILGVAAIQTRRNADVQQAGREVLIGRIQDQQKAVASLHRRIADLTAQNTAAQARDSSLAQQTRRASQRAADLAERTGFAPASGPGVQITVDDAPGGEEGTQVRDSDLATLVNGLWAAGATAVAVNGQRVTALSALRNSGSVIRINDVSLSPPYRVTALGDTRTLLARFARTTSGQTFRDLTGHLGMPVTMDNVDRLQLPAASQDLMKLSYAETGAKPDNQEEKQ